MKQILQSLNTGTIEVAELPSPRAEAGQLLLHTLCTLVSDGTERMLVEFGKANLIEKARQQPDRVRQMLDKVRTDGLLTTLDAVQGKRDKPIGLGYCNVDVVAEVGRAVDDFAVGDRIVSNGKHAEVACVLKNLCARIPDAVTDEHAIGEKQGYSSFPTSRGSSRPMWADKGKAGLLSQKGLKLARRFHDYIDRRGIL